MDTSFAIFINPPSHIFASIGPWHINHGYKPGFMLEYVQAMLQLGHGILTMDTPATAEVTGYCTLLQLGHGILTMDTAIYILAIEVASSS